jgi:hypothetical protein
MAVTLKSIAVTPASPWIPKGAKQQFTATGTYSDSSQKDITSSVTWASASTSVATIAAGGLATGKAAGTAKITAKLGSVVSPADTLTVATLKSIAVTPANSAIADGATQQFTATGTYSNSGTMNITSGLTWTSSSAKVATISGTGLASAVGAGQTTIKVASGTISGSTTLTVTGFILTGSLKTARYGHTATLLKNGLVLIAGGLYLASAELYNPATGTFTPTGNMNSERAYHTATLLSNGMVLMAGGYGPLADPLASAELYNPAKGTFTLTTGALNTARYQHTATLLSNGMVLMAGGYDGTNANPLGYLDSAELYNPATETFTPTTGTLNTARCQHTATLLSNGLVLIAGGVGPTPGLYYWLDSAELYDPVAQTFSLTGTLNYPRGNIPATLLNTGMVLVAGGYDLNIGGTYLDSAELYTPATATFSLTGSLNDARNAHSATLLDDGSVLVAGGDGSTGVSGSSLPLASAEVYEPATGTFSLTGSLNTARAYHTATLLTNGLVLVAGGQGASGGALASAELYQPAP